MENIERRYKWDNLKALLIILVVLGHFVNELTDKYENMQILYFYIYIFHMPLFLYVSGMFSRKTIQTGYKLKKKVTGYIFLGFFLKFIIIFIKLMYDHFDKFRMWKENGLSWYLFVLAMYILVTYLLRQLPGKFMLVVALLAACFVGYDSTVLSLFTLSRFFVFYPFFLLGYYTDYKTSWKIQRSIFWRVVAVAILAVFFVLVYRNISVLNSYLDLIMGWKSYDVLPEMETGGLCRLLYYVCALAMSVSVIVLIPERKTPFVAVGERTLQIYLWHRPILYILIYSKWSKWLKMIWPAHWKILYLGAGVLLAMILSMKIFGKPIDKFWKTLDCL